jgi:hypothetical protein
MEITNKEAKFICDRLGDITVGEIIDCDMVDLFVKLLNGVKNSRTEIYLTVTPGSIVDAIKTIRGMTGWGLKEAKDWYDKLDPNRNYGRIGPIVTDQSRQELINRYSQYADEYFRGGNNVTFEIKEF